MTPVTAYSHTDADKNGQLHCRSIVRYFIMIYLLYICDIWRQISSWIQVKTIIAKNDTKRSRMRTEDPLTAFLVEVMTLLTVKKWLLIHTFD